MGGQHEFYGGLGTVEGVGMAVIKFGIRAGKRWISFGGGELKNGRRCLIVSAKRATNWHELGVLAGRQAFGF